MIIFRADGNNCIGSGHIRRCLAIAKASQDLGKECMFVTADENLAGLIESNGFRTEVLNTKFDDLIGELDKLYEVIERYQPQTLFVDSYYADGEYLSALKRNNSVLLENKIAVIDDLKKEVLPCDILIHYAYNGEACKKDYEKAYHSLGLKQPQLLLGIRYAPLRAEFQNRPKKLISQNIKTVLVLTGGGDVCHIARRLLEYVKKEKWKKYKLQIVIGSLNPDADIIRELANEIDNVVIYENVDNIAELMMGADFAISAAGVTLLELYACGTPAAVYFCADNQKIGGYMRDTVGNPCLGDVRNSRSIMTDIVSVVERMDQDVTARENMSCRQQKIVDGYGAQRIAEFL